MITPAGTLQTLVDEGHFVLEVKKSRFIARCGALPEADQATARIAAFSEAEARHNCWAWRCGQGYRFHDADEPSGTAGKPILAAIDGQGLDQVIVVVTRYFGGIKLGAGGLVRAYAHAAAEALRAARRRPLIALCTLQFVLPFHLRDSVEHALRATSGGVLNCDYQADGLRMEIQLSEHERAAFVARLSNLSAGKVRPIDR